jgi:hypothetical protein
MPMIDRTDDEIGPAAVLAENDRTRAEAVAPRAISGSRDLHATASRDGLIYRRQDDARRVSADYAGGSLAFDGDDSIGGNANDVGEFDPGTMELLEAIGDEFGMTRIELRREWQAADVKLFEQISDLQATSKNLKRELKTLSGNYAKTQARIAELEQQVATLTATRVTARISELEDKVKALSAAIAGEPSARDLDSRLGYVEALVSTMFPMPRRW